MTCGQIANELPLYLYGELTQEEEERVEQHLAACTSCAVELDRVKALGRALFVAELPLSADLLADCRARLHRTLRDEAAAATAPRQSWLNRLHSLMGMHVGFSVPAGALALIAIGFLAGRVAPGGFALGSNAQQAGFVNVRAVEPDASGKVRIAFDNVSQATVSGSPDDPKIRALLLSSMKDQSNAGLRVEAAGIMKDHAADADVRGALLDALQHDPNVGVRINALEGLKRYDSSAEVRKALTLVLLNDVNAGVRMKAIDLLTAHQDQSIVGPLQKAMRKEDNGYVRTRMSKVLREMNASVGDL